MRNGVLSGIRVEDANWWFNKKFSNLGAMARSGKHSFSPLFALSASYNEKRLECGAVAELLALSQRL